MFQARQGDLLITSISKKSLPKGLTKMSKVPEENGKVILAHGEATGHSHTLPGGSATLFAETTAGVKDETKDRFLEVTNDAVDLVHQEHTPISLPKGLYKIVRQREHVPATQQRAATSRAVYD